VSLAGRTNKSIEPEGGKRADRAGQQRKKNTLGEAVPKKGNTSAGFGEKKKEPVTGPARKRFARCSDKGSSKE